MKTHMDWIEWANEAVVEHTRHIKRLLELGWDSETAIKTVLEPSILGKKYKDQVILNLLDEVQS